MCGDMGARANGFDRRTPVKSPINRGRAKIKRAEERPAGASHEIQRLRC